MLYILVPLFILGLPFFYLFSRGRLRTPGGFVLSLYIASFLSAMLIDHFSAWYSIEASAFLGLTLLLFFIPVIVHASRFNDKIKIGNYQMLVPFSWLLVFFGVISIVNLFTNIQNIFLNILTPTAYRSQVFSGAISFDYGPLQYISLIGLNWYYLQLVMFFVITVTYPKKRLLRACLFVSSLAYPLNALAVDMSRGGLLLWILMALMIYTSLYRYVEFSIRTRVNKWLLIFLLVILGLFFLVSLGRGEASGDLSMYFVDYFSHQFGNFNRFYAVASDQPNDISAIFQILGYQRESLQDEAADLLDKYGFSINVFATFVGDFIIAFDPPLVLLMAIGFAMVFWYLLRCNSQGLGTLFLVIAVCEVFLWGLFYYNHRWRISNILFLVVIGLRYFFNPHSGKTLILTPCNEFLRPRREHISGASGHLMKARRERSVDPAKGLIMPSRLLKNQGKDVDML